MNFLRQQIRTVYKKPSAKPTFWTRKTVDSQIYQVLYNYANVPEEQVSFTSNFTKDLLHDDAEKFSIYLDVCETFQLQVVENPSRRFESPRELSDWIAGHLEQQQRLVDFS